MANEQNLKPLNTRSPEEVQEITSKGGVASGKVRREKATMKKTLEMLLNEVDKKESKTYRELSTLGLIKGAIEGKADNYKTMLALLGELEEANTEPKRLDITIKDNTHLEKVMYEEDK